MIQTWLREIADHKWLALRAVLLGWAALWILWILTFQLVSLDYWLFARGVADIRSLWPDPRQPVLHFFIGGAVNAVVGWIVGRFHREHRVPFVLLFFISLLAISDLPRFIPAAVAAWGPGHERLWTIVPLDFILLRLPIVVAGIWAVRDLRGRVTCQPVQA
jgi:hypothetical protein